MKSLFGSRLIYSELTRRERVLVKQQFLIQQNGKCANSEFHRFHHRRHYLNSPLVLHHDHGTGDIICVLCQSCNVIVDDSTRSHVFFDPKCYDSLCLKFWDRNKTNPCRIVDAMDAVARWVNSGGLD